MGYISADIAPKGKRITLVFVDMPWEEKYATKEKVKTIPGSRFTGLDKGGPYWTVPLDLPTAKSLRAIFGKQLVLQDAIREWGWTAKKEWEELSHLGVADDADLELIGEILPELTATLRNYQRAGIRFIARSGHPLVADEPRLGKTLQAIGGIFESGLGDGPHLVMAPATSLEVVWKKELARWQPHPCFVISGSNKERHAQLAEVELMIDAGEPVWVVLNPDMGRYRSQFEVCDNHMSDEGVRILRACEYCEEYQVSEYPLLHTVEWNSTIVDECSRNGVRNPNSATGKGLADIKAKKRLVLTGTPMGGKPLNLWGILHYLRPDVFTSKWNWAGQWLEISDDGYGKKIGDLQKEREVEFLQSLVPFMIRRERAEVRSEVPLTEIVHVEVDMTPKQAKQYTDFAADAEVKIEEENLTATSILAEFTRLKQFSSSYHGMKDGNVYPTEESGKLEKLLEYLDERGILDGDRSQPVVIFSQFSAIVDMVYGFLAKKKIKVAKITGKVNKKGERARLIDEFQDGYYAVMCMTTTAGGTAITLDRADTAIFFDETWDPDDQEQARDRISPVTRMAPKTAIILRSKDTIEDYIAEINLSKTTLNRTVLCGVRLR